MVNPNNEASTGCSPLNYASSLEIPQDLGDLLISFHPKHQSNPSQVVVHSM